MKILLISDTHGNITKAVEAYHQNEKIDLMIHLGDVRKDAEKLKKTLPVDILSVNGNMDGDFSERGYKILHTDFGDIFVAHGHMEKVKSGLTNLLYKAESLLCKAAFFGHTHIPLVHETEGFTLVNPGSLTYPRPGSRPSYAIVNIEENGLEAEIHTI